MNAQIVLGCNGYRRYGLSMCRGTANPILDLRKLGGEYDDIMNQLDKHYKLFDKVMEDLNQIGNIVGFLSKNNLVQEHMIKLLHSYITMHRGCGLYIFIEPIQAGRVDGQ